MEELILNRYKPITQAGAGGFGTVILAWDTRMRRKVAIKCIPLREMINNQQQVKTALIDRNNNTSSDQKTSIIANNSNDQNKDGKTVDEAGEHWLENIPGLEEARTAAMIQDSNIVTVYDFELEGNTAYIIMEYVEGITLTEFLDKYSDDMTLDMLTCIFSGIAHAIDVAHSSNVLHLDIKPDNVLIDKKGKVKVTDFGLATLADEFGFGTADAGTIGYMPPEQMRRQALDVRTDEWSLAALTYEMICGYNPFDAKDIPTSLRNIQDADLVLPSNCWETFDENTDNIIFQALSPNIENRYITAMTFVDHLLPFLSNAKAGQRQIANLFKEPNAQEDDQDKPKVKKSIFSNINESLLLTITGRIFSVIASLVMAYVACANINVLGGTGSAGYFPNIWGLIIMIIVAVATIVLPGLGLCFALILLSVALILYGNIVSAGILLLLSVLWLVFSGRKSMTNANTFASFPVCGTIGFTPFAPFVTGIFCNVKDALINSLFGFIVCLYLAALGTSSLLGWDPLANGFLGDTIGNYASFQNALLAMVKQASVWVWGASWVLCAIVVSAMHNLKSRFLRIMACLIGVVFLLTGICFANYVSTGMHSWQPQGIEILPTILAFILAVIIAYFMPKRSIN